MLSVGSVVGLLKGAYLRFRTVNKVFQSLLNRQSNVRSKETAMSDIELIRKMIEVFETLMDVYNTISICFGFQTMLVFGFLFFNNIFTSFMALKDVGIQGNLSRVTLALLSLSSFLNLFSSAVICVCILLENEAKKTLKLSNAILKRSKDDMEVTLLMTFISYMKRNSPKFT